ncbi:MAG: PadR family transcriptional regulator [Candidatus Kariarchaeaceae archaeon]|jgi:PadR family transcriptional regulator PadR
MSDQLEKLLSNWETELRRGAIQLLVCAVLSEKDLHGMAICETIGTLTEGIVQVPLGTVYPLLRRFLSVGIIETYKPKGEDQRKTIYKLNSQGNDYYNSIVIMWNRYSAAVSKLLHTKKVETG